MISLHSWHLQCLIFVVALKLGREETVNTEAEKASSQDVDIVENIVAYFSCKFAQNSRCCRAII